MKNGVEVGFFFRTDAVTADLSMRDGVQLQGFDDLVGTCMVWQVGLVTQDQERDTFHGRLLQEGMELFLRHWHGYLIGRVDDKARHSY